MNINNPYIYSHPQTDCFVASQLFNVARQAGRFKRESKPAQHYVRFSVLPFSQQTTLVSLGVITHYVSAFVCLHYALPGVKVIVVGNGHAVPNSNPGKGC